MTRENDQVGAPAEEQPDARAELKRVGDAARAVIRDALLAQEQAEAECVRLREMLHEAHSWVDDARRDTKEMTRLAWDEYASELKRLREQLDAAEKALNRIVGLERSCPVFVAVRIARAALGDVAAGADLVANSAKNAEVREGDS